MEELREHSTGARVVAAHPHLGGGRQHHAGQSVAAR